MRGIWAEKQTKRGMLPAGWMSSLSAAAAGLFVGFLILLAGNPTQAGRGFAMILAGPLMQGSRGIGQVLYYATPVILTGLSVGFAFRTGLFNIGTPGQLLFGAYAAVLVGVTYRLPAGIHWIAGLFAGTAAGALWGMIPGLLAACFRVNEVISCIMTNYIGMYLVHYLVTSNERMYDKIRNYSKSVSATAVIPKLGLDRLFPGSSVTGGFWIALLAAVFVFVLLNKTVFGYELETTGFNREAARYAGMNEKRNQILSMALSGALSGLAGGVLYLAGSGKHIEISEALAGEGFLGISAALLGHSDPFGVLLAAVFLAYLRTGGFYLQLLDYTPEIIDMMIAVTIYFSACSRLMGEWMEKRRMEKGRRGNRK